MNILGLISQLIGIKTLRLTVSISKEILVVDDFGLPYGSILVGGEIPIIEGTYAQNSI